MLAQDFAELVGAFVGDGCIGYYGSSYFFQMTGHATLDRAYYDATLVPTLKKCFPEINHRISTNGNVLRLTVYSKALVRAFQRLGFPLGPKARTARVPQEILATQAFHASFLRGLFDTDGSVFFDKRATYRKPYPRIDLHLQNAGLVHQVHELLSRLGVPSTITTQATKVQINGPSVKIFLDKIGFSNDRHRSKLE